MFWIHKRCQRCRRVYHRAEIIIIPSLRNIFAKDYYCLECGEYLGFVKCPCGKLTTRGAILSIADKLREKYGDSFPRVTKDPVGVK